MKDDIDKGIEDAKAGRISELTEDMLEGEEKMTTLKRVEKLWDEYCKSCDIHVTGDITVQLNPSEPSLKVSICKGQACMDFTLEEIKALAWALDGI